MIIVTGGAGFIGSCIVRVLNDMGIEDIVIVDHIRETDKWINMRNKKYIEYVNRDLFLGRLPELAGQVTHMIHMGACSATTERDFDFLYQNNLEYTKSLWKFCAENQITQTSHIQSVIRTLKKRYFSPQNTIMQRFPAVPKLPAYIVADDE